MKLKLRQQLLDSSKLRGRESLGLGIRRTEDGLRPASALFFGPVRVSFHSDKYTYIRYYRILLITMKHMVH